MTPAESELSKLRALMQSSGERGTLAAARMRSKTEPHVLVVYATLRGYSIGRIGSSTMTPIAAFYNGQELPI